MKGSTAIARKAIERKIGRAVASLYVTFDKQFGAGWKWFWLYKGRWYRASRYWRTREIARAAGERYVRRRIMAIADGDRR